MKLVDLLVEELPKNGGWPDGMVKAWQSNVDAEVYFVDDNNLTTNEVRTLYEKAINKKLADSGLENSVTSEQYESALAAKNEGWIAWGGGECPVGGDSLIDVKFRDSMVSDMECRAGSYIWIHRDNYDDIIAYRLHKTEVKAVEWNGEGLPPIGVECVVTPHNSLWGFSSVDNYTGKVLAYDGEDFWFVMLGGVKVTSRTDKVDFSLPRTEAERKIAKAKFQIAELCRKSSSNGHSADLIYNAIADGEIEGVKLEGN